MVESSHCSTPGARLCPTVGAHSVQVKEKWEGGGNLQPTQVSSNLQASANLRDWICHTVKETRNSFPVRIVSDQLHAEGSLKTFPMLNLVN